MASTYTTNKVLELPANGDYVDTWNVPANGDFSIIDQAFGGQTSLNATSGDATLTASQYRSLILSISGAIAASVFYTIPSGVGGQWIVRNSTTDSSGGPWSITILSGGGGANVVIPRGGSTIIFSDGTNIYAATGAGVNGQVIYNSAGVLTGSTNLTFNGTTLTANALSVQNNMTAGGNVTATGNVSSSANITAGGDITATGNVTAYSDASLKADVKTITDALETVLKLRGVSYTMINSGEAGIGVIAQETREVLPQVVKDNNGILSVAYANMVGVLIEAIKELSEKVDRLENK
jgi:hypothetical protein